MPHLCIRFLAGLLITTTSMLSGNSSIISLEMPSIKRIEAIAQSMEGCISLAQGALRLGGIDQHTKEYARQILLTDKADYYGDSLGLAPLRQKLALTLSRSCNAPINVQNIFIGHGGLGVLSALALALLKTGDEILLPEPAYPAYTNIAKLAKATPVFVAAYELRKTEAEPHGAWKFDIELLKSAITSKTKILLLSHPSNPTGVCLSNEELRQLSSLCEDKGIYLIIDEVYDDFIYEGDFTSGTAFALQSPFTIRVGSFSKNYGMSGWRVGFAVAHQDLVAAIAPVQAATIGNATGIAQYAALYALEHPEHIAHYATILKKNRDVMCNFFDSLQAKGIISYERPKAGFYLFFKIHEGNTTELIMDILKNAKVAMTPGNDFGPSAQQFIRLCFARDPEVVTESIVRLKKYFSDKHPHLFTEI